MHYSLLQDPIFPQHLEQVPIHGTKHANGRLTSPAHRTPRGEEDAGPRRYRESLWGLRSDGAIDKIAFEFLIPGIMGIFIASNHLQDALLAPVVSGVDLSQITEVSEHRRQVTC